jgi:hypothetical protein
VRLRAGLGALIGVLMLTTASCGDDDSTASDDSSDHQSAETAATTTTTVDEEAAVLAAYEAGWAAFATASNKPANPADPGLAETMTGAALEAASGSLRELSETGDYFAGPPVDHSASVRELATDRAVIDDCATDPTVRYAADGSVSDGADTTPYAYEAVMVKEEGVWKNSELNMGEPCEG